MRRNCVFVLLISLLMSSCSTKKPADLIVTNATVYTVDEAFSKAESFAVADGKIVSTGSTEEILAEYTSENILDARGQVCLSRI
jgi:predicted amidohydrolase YtcJ